MKKIFTSLLLMIFFSLSMAQNYWNKTSMQGKAIRQSTNVTSYYSLDIKQLRAKLEEATVQSKSAKPLEIIFPTLDGKLEKFAVYSAPVVVKSLADKYQLGSYVGIGIDDPLKTIRFSTAPNDFQSMIMKNGQFEFIEPQNTNKTVYGVHPKTNKGGEYGFLCSMNESKLSKEQIDRLFKAGKSYSQSGLISSAKAFDKKYRTMRLALSVTGEYTTYFGGTAGALAQMNATMTRVNGILEKDLTLQLILQDFPQLIYTNASTDPYSPSDIGKKGAWNTELQNTLTNTIGNAVYDIGHLFGATGGGGNSGCIGCVCVDDTTSTTDKNKGSGYTSPVDDIPMGDSFDVDYVIHEMGHQLGANHTFSLFNESGTMVQVEPGTGSTIMGYAGIGALLGYPNTDVQMHSDPYFSIMSIIQIDTNLALATKTCDIETAVTNNPPVITAMADVTIPKGTAFVLTAQATDTESDPITYCWEEVDDATSNVNTVTGNNTTGALFRSWNPTTSPTRYFPKFSSVLAGNLTIPTDWETVSNVARNTNFRVTVRDNNPNVLQQQVAHSLQKVTVGADGPFKITSTKVYNNISTTFNWDVVNTNASPYNVSNVKIDYTTNDGASWVVLAASTPNDGSEMFNFSTVPNNTPIKVRVSAIGNVFYAISNITVSTASLCDGSAPSGLALSGITNSQVTASWDVTISATYILRYRKIGTTIWTEVPVSANTYTITGLLEETQYEIQVATVCSGTTGAFSSSINFTTLGKNYCAMTSSDSSDEYISNVTVTPANGANVMNNTSVASTYTDYSTDDTKIVKLIKGSSGNSISVTKAWPAKTYDETVTVWIDFNRDGLFDNGTGSVEKIMATAADKTTPVTATFVVPATAYFGDKSIKMRVALQYISPPTDACTSYSYGEVEDYKVMISENLATNDVAKSQVQVFPNPVDDIINISKVSNNAKYIIYSNDGKLVSKGLINNNKLNVSKLPKGVYVISIDNNGESVQAKFIKK